MNTIEEETCTEGTHVMDQADCQAAAEYLGKNWYAGSVGNWANHIPGCLEGFNSGGFNFGVGNGNMHFNLVGSYGLNQRGYAVCQLERNNFLIIFCNY